MRASSAAAQILRSSSAAQRFWGAGGASGHSHRLAAPAPDKRVREIGVARLSEIKGRNVARGVLEEKGLKRPEIGVYRRAQVVGHRQVRQREHVRTCRSRVEVTDER